MSAIAEPTVIAAQPYLARNPESAWARVGQIRDSIHQSFVAAGRRENVDALVHKSLDFEYPAWVLLQAWLPTTAEATTDRVRLLVYIEPKPHFAFEFVYTIHCFREGREKTYGPLVGLTDEKLAPWVAHVLGRGPKPPHRPYRLRQLPFQLWYPRNRVKGLKTDPLKLGMYFSVALGIGGMASSEPAVGVALLLLAAVLAFFGRRRYPLYINVGRPDAEPRVLRLVDSWQTVLAGLGGAWADVRARLHARLRETNIPGIHNRVENISYLTPDGKQEREQVALHLGRGIVFCHLYAYGEDLYVGWDAFMNYGSWNEREVARGYDRDLGKLVILNDVKPEVTRVTEYDLIDLNCVTEWAHARIVAVLKQVIAERKIDQEIDFRVTRGERQSLLKDEGGERGRRAAAVQDRPWVTGGPAPRFSRTA